MNRSDYHFAPLSFAQYEAIVTAGTMQGTSPLHGQQNHDAAIAQARAGDVDLRALLAALLWEDHFGTDPDGGVELAKVYNFGGIKWAGQPGAYDSGIPYPLAEGVGNYAGFNDFGGFVAELIRTLNNQYCGPAFTAGDLARAWGIYIGGPNNPNMAGGQARVDQWQYYLTKYPPEVRMVTGQDILNKAASFIGQPNSYGIDGNGVHPWAYWCEAFVEMVHEQCGLIRVRYPSALSHAKAMNLSPGRAPIGAMCFFGTDFYSPDGHIAVGTGDGRVLGTLTDGTGVGYRNWNETTTGYLGWAYHPGVSSDVPVVDTFYAEGNPYGAIPIRVPFWNRWHALDTLGLALPTYGWAKAPERTINGRRVQEFERGWLATGDGQNPWDVVGLTLAEQPK